MLRVAWVEAVMRFNVGMVESRLLDFSLASLEVIRRGHWNFYRYCKLWICIFQTQNEKGGRKHGLSHGIICLLFRCPLELGTSFLTSFYTSEVRTKSPTTAMHLGQQELRTYCLRYIYLYIYKELKVLLWLNCKLVWGLLNATEGQSKSDLDEVVG